MAEIRTVTESGDILTEMKSQPNPQTVLSGPVTDELEGAVHQLLGIETESDKSRNSEKVQAIVSWAKTQTEDHSPENIKWIIRDLEFKVGSPGIGEKMIDYLYSYVGLIDQKKEIETKLKKYNPYGK